MDVSDMIVFIQYLFFHHCIIITEKLENVNGLFGKKAIFLDWILSQFKKNIRSLQRNPPKKPYNNWSASQNAADLSGGSLSEGRILFQNPLDINLKII